MAQQAQQQEEKLRIIPLGGVDEFGKNITVVEYGEDMLVVDCGSIFPKEDMLGVDLVIPDVTYLIQNISAPPPTCSVRCPCPCTAPS